MRVDQTLPVNINFEICQKASAYYKQKYCNNKEILSGNKTVRLGQKK